MSRGILRIFIDTAGESTVNLINFPTLKAATCRRYAKLWHYKDTKILQGRGYKLDLPPYHQHHTNGRANRPFPSSKKSHFQNEAKCEAIDMKMIFNYYANKTHFHNKGFALSLVLKVRFFGTRKWPIIATSRADWVIPSLFRYIIFSNLATNLI